MKNLMGKSLLLQGSNLLTPNRSRLFLYSNGDENLGITGGWKRASTTTYYTTFNKNADNLEITGYKGVGGECSISTINAVTVSNFSKLFIDITAIIYMYQTYPTDIIMGLAHQSGYTYHILYATNNIAIKNTVLTSLDNPKTVVRQVYELDISNLYGSYYPVASTTNGLNSNFKLYNCWLE